MLLDVADLRHATVENLARLLRALGLPLPALAYDESLYHRRLVRAAWIGLDDDRRNRAAERWRAMTDAEKRTLIATMLDALEEDGGEGKHPREVVARQLSRMLDLVGVEWVAQRIEQAKNSHKPGARTLGGTFFLLCRQDATLLVNRTYVPVDSAQEPPKGITRRQFFRAFTSRLPKQRPEVVRPVPKGKECVRQLSAGPNCFRSRSSKREESQRRIAAPEVMVVRRKVG